MSEIRDNIEPIENVDFTNWKKNKFTTLIISLISTIFLSACLGFVIIEIGLFSFGAIILFSIILFGLLLLIFRYLDKKDNSYNVRKNNKNNKNKMHIKNTIKLKELKNNKDIKKNKDIKNN